MESTSDMRFASALKFCSTDFGSDNGSILSGKWIGSDKWTVRARYPNTWLYNYIANLEYIETTLNRVRLKTKWDLKCIWTVFEWGIHPLDVWRQGHALSIAAKHVGHRIRVGTVFPSWQCLLAHHYYMWPSAALRYDIWKKAQFVWYFQVYPLDGWSSVWVQGWWSSCKVRVRLLAHPPSASTARRTIKSSGIFVWWGTAD